MTLTDEKLREIQDRNKAKLPPLPSRIEPEIRAGATRCSLCNEPVELPPGPRPPVGKVAHKACIARKHQEAVEAAQKAAKAQREAEVEAVRFDAPGTLARCGVPAKWLRADLGACQDVPDDIMGQIWNWAANPAGTLYLYGGVGAGKTWVGVGCLARVLVTGLYLPADCMFVSERMFLARVKDGFDGKDRANPAATVGLLLLDDLGASRLTDWGRNEIAGLVEARHAADLPTIITSNIDPDGLAKAVDGRVLSRIAESRMMIHFPDKDLRIHGTNRSR